MKRVVFIDEIMDDFVNAQFLHQLANAKSSSKSIFTRNIILLIEHNYMIHIYIEKNCTAYPYFVLIPIFTIFIAHFAIMPCFVLIV